MKCVLWCTITGGDEILFIGMGADERCAQEWWYLKILDFPDPITHEELTDA